MTEYIRKAVELADGWSITIDDQGEMTSFYAPMWLPKATIKEMSKLGVRFDKVSQQMLDALAAQLVRQVDALSDYGVFTEPEQTHVWETEPEPEILGGELYEGGKWWHAEGPDRTPNTIKCIVESKVLEHEVLHD